MRALVHHGAGDLRVEEVADAAPAHDEVLIEVTAAGVCGTDRHIVAGELGVEPGTVPGHEIAGRVAALGDDVRRWRTGQRVAAYGQVVCGGCRSCRSGASHRCRRPQVFGMGRQGGFAELVAVPQDRVFAVPDGVDDEVAAIVPDAIATPQHALVTIGRLEAEETVVVVGAGGLGLQAVMLARLHGAGRVVAVDPSGAAREAASTAGADEVFDPSGQEDAGRALRGLARDATLALECVGSAATAELGMRVLIDGGRLVIVGVGHQRPRLPPLLRFVADELSVHGSFGSTATEIETVLELVAGGRLDTTASISRRVPLDQAPGVFAEPPTPGRTVIDPRS